MRHPQAMSDSKKRPGVMTGHISHIGSLLLAAALVIAVMLAWSLLPTGAGPAAAQGGSPGTEPTNVQVAPGDGSLTVSWTITSREGVADAEIKHALRWSQVSGVWANPQDAKAGGPEDGIAVAGGVASYTITGLTNDVATGVFMRSFTGGDHSERSGHSSPWVRTKGDHTTPRAAQPEPTPQQQQDAPPSSDATLSRLQIFMTDNIGPDAGWVVTPKGSAYALTPAFDPQVTQYAVRIPESAYSYAEDVSNRGPRITAVVASDAAAPVTFLVTGRRLGGETRDPKQIPVRPDTHPATATGEGEGNGPWASGPWGTPVGYTWVDVKVTAPDGTTTKTYSVKVEYGPTGDPRNVKLTPGDGKLTLTWEHPASGKAHNYFARWRKAGTTAWLNQGNRDTALDSAITGAKGGAWVWSQGSSPLTAAITGLENGVEYEVELEALVGGGRNINRNVPVERKDDWITSGWVSVRGTPAKPAAQPKTELTITPTAPTREYGGTDDLSYTVGGLASGDAAASVVTGALARASGDDAGSYAFDLSGLAVAPAYAGKYSLPSAPAVANYVITARPITAISGVTVNRRASDGTTDATFDTSNADGTGVLAGELADFQAGGLQVSGTFAAATPGTHAVSVTYSLQDQGGFKAANYTLSAATDTLQGEITAVAACAPWLMLLSQGRPAEGGNPVTVTVGLKDPAGPGGVSVTLTTGGTATGDDYTLSSGVVTVAPGDTAATVTITVTDDTVDDDDETIILTASARLPGASGSPTMASLTLTIADNDGAANDPLPSSDDGTDTACATPADGDYDADDDGLIEVCSLAQLNAIRWNLDGDGSASDAGYAAAFPDAAANMGCPSLDCLGYELTADLDFDTNGSGDADAGDDYWNGGRGWTPIGEGRGPYSAIFEGNGHTISNLYIVSDSPKTSSTVPASPADGTAALFAFLLNGGVIRNLGMESVHLDTSKFSRGTGGLVGVNDGVISDSYVTGSLRGRSSVGGIAGMARGYGLIVNSYSTASVTGTLAGVEGGFIGGLVGYNQGKIHSSYSTGVVSGKGRETGGLAGFMDYGSRIVASYKHGPVSSSGYNIGGLVGTNQGVVMASYFAGSLAAGERPGGVVGRNMDPRVLVSYYDNWLTSHGGAGGGYGTGLLQKTVGYSGIYANWNVDLDGDGNADDPWDFGTSCHYPVLKGGSLNPDDQRPSQCTEAVKEPAEDPGEDPPAADSPTHTGHVYEPEADILSVTMDTETSVADNDLTILTMTLPPGATLTPEFASDRYTYTLTVPDDAERIGIRGRFVRNFDWNSWEEGFAFAWTTKAGMTAKDVFDGSYDGHKVGIANSAGPRRIVYFDAPVECKPVNIAINVTKWLPDRVGEFPLHENVVTQTYSLALVRDCIPEFTGFRDYDDDDDGLIEVSGPAQLNAIRWDLDGDGRATDAGYATAFPEAAAGMGCPSSGCVGYELAGDIDLAGTTWTPIMGYSAVLEGNGHAIRSLSVSGTGDFAGLFGKLASGGVARNLALASVDVSGADKVGALAGRSAGSISKVSVSGVVSGRKDVGGLVGYNEGSIRASSAAVSVSGTANNVGGMVGSHGGSIIASYASGDATSTGRYVGGLVGNHWGTITASYAAGDTTTGSDAGGLVGHDGGTITASYWDSDESQATGTGGEGKTTAELQTPTGYAGIYANWNVDLDGDGSADDPWDFGTASQYPVLRPRAPGVPQQQHDGAEGVTVSPTTLNISEDGTATYSVVLDSQPTADVTVTPASSDDGATAVTPASRTFTSSNWDTVQTFAVSGVADADRNYENVTVSHDVASDDARYNGIAVDGVSVAVSDTTLAPSREPMVLSTIGDATIVDESWALEVSLAEALRDAVTDPLSVTASSSDETVATVSVSADYSTLTVSARARGAAVITVTADYGPAGTMEIAFTVTVKAVPVAARTIGDISGLETDDTHYASLAGVFRDADGDALTISAASSDDGKATASVTADGSKVAVAGVAAGEVTVTVTARDTDGNRVSAAFDVSVVAAPAEAKHGEPVGSLRCIARPNQVAFAWTAPQWSGGEVYAYDYSLSLPDGRREQTRLRDTTSVNKRGNYPAGKDATIVLKVVYELPDGNQVRSAAAALTCRVGE